MTSFLEHVYDTCGQLFKAFSSQTSSLGRQLDKYTPMRTTLSNAKDSHFFFQQKNNSVFVIFAFKILTKLTNDVVNFEQPGPGCLIYYIQSHEIQENIDEI